MSDIVVYEYTGNSKLIGGCFVSKKQKYRRYVAKSSKFKYRKKVNKTENTSSNKEIVIEQ